MRYGFAPGQLYPAKWDISDEGEKEVCVEVPLSLVADEVTRKDAQVKEYKLLAAQFKAEVAGYLRKGQWIYNWVNVIDWGTKFSAWWWHHFDTANNYYTYGISGSLLNVIPFWPVPPKPYKGPTVAFPATRENYVKGRSLILDGGLGAPSAGMLKISGGSKSFGVLGQEKPDYFATLPEG